MNYKILRNKDDPKEIRRHEDRLSKRLQSLGYSLSKGVTETLMRSCKKIQLKRVSPMRGFKITNMATRAVELGEKHNLTLGQIEAFWLQKHNERWEEKRRAKKAKEAMKKRKRKASPKVETLPAVWW